MPAEFKDGRWVVGTTPTPEKLEWAILHRAEMGLFGLPLHENIPVIRPRKRNSGTFRREVQTEMYDIDMSVINIEKYIDPEINRLTDEGFIQKDKKGFWHATDTGKKRAKNLHNQIWPRPLPFDPYA